MAECVWLANTLKAAGLAADPPPNKAGFAGGWSWRCTLKQAFIRLQTKIDPARLPQVVCAKSRDNQVTGK